MPGDDNVDAPNSCHFTVVLARGDECRSYRVDARIEVERLLAKLFEADGATARLYPFGLANPCICLELRGKVVRLRAIPGTPCFDGWVTRATAVSVGLAYYDCGRLPEKVDWIDPGPVDPQRGG